MIPVCPPGTQASAPGPPPSGIGGRLLHATDRLPLGGLMVGATVTSRQAAANAPPEQPLGTGRSDVNGVFVIATLPGQDTATLVSLLSTNPQVGVILRVGPDQGNSLYLTTPPLAVPRGRLEVQLAVALPAFNVPATLWAELSKRLSQKRVQRFNDILKTLLAMTPDRLFSDWPIEQRYGIVTALQAAFLDPTSQLRALAGLPSFAQFHRPGALQDYCARLGQREPAIRAAFLDLKTSVDTFNDLLSVDWILNTSALANGDPNSVLRQARERYRLRPS